MEDGVLVTLTDTTALKKLQHDLENFVNDLKKSNENLQEFAYVASHDLQEPLRKIQFFSERLQMEMEGKLSRENLKLFERMVAATERMSQLISDLLSYSQLSTKPSTFNTIDLKELIQLVLGDLEATITKKKAVITVGELPIVKGDPIQLRQLFQNLLSNSLKYSKEEIPPYVSIKATIVDKELNGLTTSYSEIEVTDNGIGFEQQHVERIFKVFQRLHGRSEYPGTGIGLAIVQKVVENHHGSIIAESEPGEGATFKVYLPV
jgi:light-regulated signal transduction histidine kinase (bacteriophytochrome)